MEFLVPSALEMNQLPTENIGFLQRSKNLVIPLYYFIKRLSASFLKLSIGQAPSISKEFLLF